MVQSLPSQVEMTTSPNSLEVTSITPREAFKEMDQLTAFVTIVELLSIFSQERDSSKTKGHLNFLRWLENHNHQELKDLICTNQQLSMEISKLLAEDTVTILNHVAETNRILGSILARIDFFSGLSTSIATPHLLSSQALEILANFYASSALAMMPIETGAPALRGN